MFLQLKDGEMLNTHWLNDVFIEENENNKVVFEMVNGSKKIEEYSSDTEAEARKEEVYKLLTE